MEKGYNVNKPFNMYMFAPKNLSPEIANKINLALKKWTADKRVKADLAKILASPSYMTQKQQVEYLTNLSVYLKSVAKEAGIGKK